MASFDQLPQARIVRKAGQSFVPPPEPPRPPGPVASAMREQLRGALEVAVGMWPLTAVLIVMAGFVILAGNYQGP